MGRKQFLIHSWKPVGGEGQLYAWSYAILCKGLELVRIWVTMEVLESIPQEYRGTIVVKFGGIQKFYVNFFIARAVSACSPYATQGSALHSL